MTNDYIKVILDESATEIVKDFIKGDEPNLIPENIKKDVDILGVIGTYGGDPEPTFNLDPFVVSGSLDKVVVDPNGLSSDALNNLIQTAVTAFGGEDVPLFGLDGADYNGVKIFVRSFLRQGSGSGSSYIGVIQLSIAKAYIQGQEDNLTVYYSPEDLDIGSGSGAVHYSQGWHKRSYNGQPEADITETITFNLQTSQTAQSNEFSEYFNTLNGFVFGKDNLSV